MTSATDGVEQGDQALITRSSLTSDLLHCYCFCHDVMMSFFLSFFVMMSFFFFFVMMSFFVMMAASVMSDTRFEIAEKRIEVDQKTNLISIVHCSHDDPIFSLTMMMMTMMAMMTTMMMTVVMATWWEGMEWSILGSNK